MIVPDEYWANLDALTSKTPAPAWVSARHRTTQPPILPKKGGEFNRYELGGLLAWVAG